MDFLSRHLVPGYSEDDIVLEVIILIGTAASEKRCAKMIANSSIIPALADTLLRM